MPRRASPPPSATSRRPGDRLFNPQPWGSWFEFALPDLPVALDSRIEVFPPQVWDDYAAVTDGVVGWEAILDRWGVTIVVVPADDESFVERLRAAGWNAAYADEDAVVLHRGWALTVRRRDRGRHATAILSA